MKRIRWTLLLLALGIALPAVLIVQRAINSLELENAVRHDAVAERILDEMELPSLDDAVPANHDVDINVATGTSPWLALQWNP